MVPLKIANSATTIGWYKIFSTVDRSKTFLKKSKESVNCLSMRVAKLAFNVCRRIPRSENRTNSFARLQQSSIHLSDSVLLMKTVTTYTCTVSGRPALLRGSVGCHLGVRDQTAVSPQITNWWLRQDLIREHLFRCHLIPQLCFH